MNRIVVAQELVKLARGLMSYQDGQPFYAVVTVGPKKVMFRIKVESKEDALGGQDVTGTEPYKGKPMEALERVFELIRKHGVPEDDVEILTQ